MSGIFGANKDKFLEILFEPCFFFNFRDLWYKEEEEESIVSES